MTCRRPVAFPKGIEPNPSGKPIGSLALENGKAKRRESMPKLKSFFTNMSTPMPLHTKIRLLLRNNFIKLKTGKSCCGHHGEPGC